jgi:hypothetical protein
MRGGFVLLTAACLLAAPVALAQDHQHHEPPPAQTQPQQPAQPSPQTMPHDMGEMQDTGGMHDMHDMTGVLGPYPMSREASGTSWQPDASEHMGVMRTHGAWMVMGHVTLNGVYDWQDGPRGDEKAFVSGMIMGMARREVGTNGALNLRLMLSPDPFMGRSGYPLLLAAGETANGVTPLVDRQHPHELFMELSGSYAHRFGPNDSGFIYLGYPGEPAFGPPAFMHRLSTMDSPEAPITHHWFDSTHITFGVLTAGWTHGDWKVEASSFTGREPDEDRYDFDDPEMDSTAVRLSWNPTERWALQASWADLESPEQLEPDEDETRWSVSAIYTVPMGDGRWWSTTLVYGEKAPGDDERLGAWAVETAYRPHDNWTVFARAEQIESDDLLPGSVETVSKASVGAVRDFRVHENAVIGVGALYSYNWVSDALEPSYDGDQEGAMAFVRLRVG